MVDMRCYYREKKYISGDYMDVMIYPVFAKSKVRRSRAKPTSEAQEKINAENSKRKLTRLIHCNFTNRDNAVHLTYADGNEPKDADQARKDAQSFIRKLKRRFEKLGIDFKYIWVCEIGERSGRIHHHLIVSGGLSRDAIEELWQYGYANVKRLQFNENGVVGLSTYMTKQKLLFKRWSASRNLSQPRVLTDDYKYSQKDIKDIIQSGDFYIFLQNYEGCGLTDYEAVENKLFGGGFIRASFYDTEKVKVFRRE